MSNQSDQPAVKLVAFRIGDAYCLSSSRSLEAIDIPPPAMSQVPGTKPWVLGVGRLGRELVAFISVSRLLSIPPAQNASAFGSEVALFVNGGESIGTIGIVVDEVVGFMPAGDFLDHDDPEMRIPPGLGACVRGTLRNDIRTWAYIDLKALLADPKIKKIDL